MIEPKPYQLAGVAALLASRQAVRITYHRSHDAHDVDLVHGDDVVRNVAFDLADEDVAECMAAREAQALDLDVIRLDVS